MTKNLLYKPRLGYEKNYYTEGNLYNFAEDENSNNDGLSTKPFDKLDNLKDLTNEIIGKLPLIPEEVLDTFLPPFFISNSLIEEMNNNKENIPVINPEEEPDFSLVPKPDEDNDFSDMDDIPDDPFGREDDVYVDIKINTIPDDVLIESEYTKDLMDILEDYLLKYNKVLDEYINSTLTFLTHSKQKRLDYIPTKNLKDKNLSHVSDYITKSKITLKQNLLLYRKLYDMDQTIYQIRAVKVANEQRKRYSLNKRIEDTDMIAKGGNDLLKESKMISQKKYEENFYSLYKYLNSSVILFDESIKIVIKQKKMLVLLNNREREN